MDLPLRDLVAVTYRLMILWYTQDEWETEQTERVEKFFRDQETEYETGELSLPGWAGIGNAAAQYGVKETPPFE